MAKEWIGKLASEIKEKEHGAAEKLKRDGHYQQVLRSKGEQFL